MSVRNHGSLPDDYGLETFDMARMRELAFMAKNDICQPNCTNFEVGVLIIMTDLIRFGKEQRNFYDKVKPRKNYHSYDGGSK